MNSSDFLESLGIQRVNLSEDRSYATGMDNLQVTAFGWLPVMRFSLCLCIERIVYAIV